MRILICWHALIIDLKIGKNENIRLFSISGSRIEAHAENRRREIKAKK